MLPALPWPSRGGKKAGPLRSSPATGAHNETNAVWIVLARGPVKRDIVSRQCSFPNRGGALGKGGKDVVAGLPVLPDVGGEVHRFLRGPDRLQDRGEDLDPVVEELRGASQPHGSARGSRDGQEEIGRVDGRHLRDPIGRRAATP
jgi:hypothetical protein